MTARRWNAAAATFSGVVALATHARALGNGFLSFDDDVYVTANPVVLGGLTPNGLRWAFHVGYAANWHPLTWISHMTDVTLFGVSPWGHHLTSWILHAVTAALVALVLSKMLARDLPAEHARVATASGLAAAYWAAHPWRVESVAWIAERKDVLSGVLALLAVSAYLAYGRRPTRRGYAMVTALLALGLTAKPMLVSIPVIFLLLDVWPLDRQESWKRLVFEKTPWAALAAASCALTLAAQRAGGTLASIDAVGLGKRFSNALVSAASYAYGLVWPGAATVMHRYPPLGWSIGVAATAAIGLASMTAAAIALRKLAPWFLVGWGWFIVSLLPVIGLVQVGVQSRADRYTYLPHIGLVLILAAGGVRVCRSRPLALASVATALMAIVGAGSATWAYTASWRDTETLLTKALRVEGDDPYVHYFLALDYESRSLAEDAERNAREAVRLHPGLWQAWNLLGRILAVRRSLGPAAEAYEHAVATAPASFEGWLGLGVVRALADDDAGAQVALETAERIAPEDPRPFLWRAALALKRNDLDAARAQERELRKRDPAMADAVAADIAAGLRDGGLAP